MTSPTVTQGKSLLLVVVPIVLTGILGIIDNALRWRAEMEQKQFDRQTRILDKIMDIHDPVQREVVTQFYLDTGLFTGSFKQELEISLATTTKQLATVKPSDVETKVDEPVVGSTVPIFELPTKIDLPTNLDMEAIRARWQERQHFNNKTIFSFEGGVSGGER